MSPKRVLAPHASSSLSDSPPPRIKTKAKVAAKVAAKAKSKSKAKAKAKAKVAEQAGAKTIVASCIQWYVVNLKPCMCVLACSCPQLNRKVS